MKRHTPAEPDPLDQLFNIMERWVTGYRPEFPQLGEQFVPGEGNYDAPTAFILGEAPGAQEIMARRPFIGPAGRVLRDLMATAGLYTEDHDLATGGKFIPVKANCWLTNTVKFRPPSNRTPTEKEIAHARALIRDEWYAVGCPRVVIAVGAVAHEALTGKRVSILKTSGKPREVQSRQEGVTLTLWPMVHPAFALRNAPMRPILEKDWVKLGEWLNERSL